MKPLKKPDAIFFDWDGTLVDSLPALLTFYNHVFEKFGHPQIDIEQAKKTIRLSAREVFPKIFGDKADEAFAVYFDIVEKTHLTHLTAFVDSFPFLQHLSDMKIPLGVVSNKRHKFLLREINHLGWDKYLTSNIGAGEAAKDKPAPDPLIMAAEKMGLNPSQDEIWYVGDTETDMLAAVAAGFQPIFIEHGLGTRQDCEKHAVSPYFVKDLPDLIALVEKYR